MRKILCFFLLVMIGIGLCGCEEEPMQPVEQAIDPWVEEKELLKDAYEFCCDWGKGFAVFDRSKTLPTKNSFITKGFVCPTTIEELFTYFCLTMRSFCCIVNISEELFAYFILYGFVALSAAPYVFADSSSDSFWGQYAKSY